MGVQMQSGKGSEISDVDLAAGISLAFVSRPQMKRISNNAKDTVQPVRLLLGAVYGATETLGNGLNVGGSYALGETLSVHREWNIKFICGLGFRF